MKKYLYFTILTGFMALGSSHVSADYNEALDLYKSGRYHDSLTAIAAELVVADDLNPTANNYKLRFLAGHNHWKLKNYANALIHLKRCIDIKPDSVDAMLDISMILLEQKRLREASSYAYRALKKDKENALAFYLLGKIKYIYKNYWGAKQLFEKALAFDTELYDSWNYLGMTLMNLKSYSKANTAFSMAHAMKPDSVEILNNLAVSYIFLKKKSDALKAIESALKIEPENEIVLKNKDKAASLPD